MKDSFLELILALIAISIWGLLLYFIVRAAVRSAIERVQDLQRQTNQLLGAQAEMTGRLAKHLIAQTDLMLAQARHQGMTEEQLEPVLKQVAERKAEPAFSLPFS
jgi:hypothetical protein